MASPIEDYAFLSDLQSAALVAKDGSVDWLCFPRIDSASCFAALLGGPEHGRWLVAPAGRVVSVHRAYRPGTLVLDTTFTTAEGEVRVTDFMPVRDRHPDLMRIVEGIRGRVTMTTELVVRFGHGAVLPWVRRVDGAWTATAGPDSLQLLSPIELEPTDHRSGATFTVGPGDQVPFTLTWHPSHEPLSRRESAARALAGTVGWWEGWSGRCAPIPRWNDEVRDSLVVLKGLTNVHTGGVVAAASTSLPEELGGARNWDYRFCWLRDATFTLLALVDAGYTDEAAAWRDWLLRAVAGDVDELQIMYGVAGERRLTEEEVDWLPGYAGSRPVRIGNAAHAQFQLDVYGEVLDCLAQAASAGLPGDADAWSLQRQLVGFVDRAWMEPDEGIWEVRGPRRHFTHSKVMAWVAVDRAITSAERFGFDGDLGRWRRLRVDIHRWVLDNCVDERGVLVQHPGTRALDASNLLVPILGFLPPSDPRVRATVEAIEQELDEGGYIRRYDPDPEVEGLPGSEGAFLLCSFWLADCLHLIGRTADAEARFEHLLALRNDVGLLAEEVDPPTGAFLGNIPQAFSHTAVVNTAATLATPTGGARHRHAHAPPGGRPLS